MAQHNDKTFGEIGEIHLSQMGTRIQPHVDPIVDPHYTQAEETVRRNHSKTVTTSEDLHSNEPDNDRYRPRRVN